MKLFLDDVRDTPDGWVNPIGRNRIMQVKQSLMRFGFDV